ncbi:MAG: histidine kinase [Pyrinomonadaceae bacterium]
MNVLNPAVLINLLGFTVGVALYGLLLMMVVRYRVKNSKIDYLILTTAVLGFLWNTGELFSIFYRDISQTSVSPLLSAASFSALGFLPSVVVHSAEKSKSRFGVLSAVAYALSFLALIVQFQSAIFDNSAPSNFALKILSFGSVALLAGLLVKNFRQTLDKKAVWISSLLIFAVSAFHLSGAAAEESSWLVELVAHQSSLPLAIAILLQDYRFAFADLFLKRAVSLILLALLAFGLYVFVASPLLRFHETHDRNDAQAIGLILTLWMATALVYPSLHNFAVWLVDKIILDRADYEKLQVNLIEKIEKTDKPSEILEIISANLKAVLTANFAKIETDSVIEISTFSNVNISPNSTEIFIPTVEQPFPKIVLTDFTGGRRLLSEEISLLESVALFTARRIDAVRVTDERISAEKREQEFSKLATEAQLAALRAQINPHFLFNSLTTIGYLINSAPEKAFQTLMKLTKLLRESLRQTSEFSTLGEEIELIENYLEIEKARFEERLEVKIDVANELKKIRVPALILQPLVENAVKHGISKNKNGGEIKISAKLETIQNEVLLKLTVFDSGAGKNASLELNSNGVGLKNIRERLENYYDKISGLKFTQSDTHGSTAEIVLPVNAKMLEKK